jgi:hypothetical protein
MVGVRVEVVCGGAAHASHNGGVGKVDLNP